MLFKCNWIIFYSITFACQSESFKCFRFTLKNKPKYNILMKNRGEYDDLSNEPFKTGRHTYASWDSTKSSEDQLPKYDEDDNDESEEFRQGPILSFFKKLYDFILFYGLDPPPTESTNKNFSQNKVKSSKKSKKTSPFFTESERMSEDFINSRYSSEDSYTDTENNNYDDRQVTSKRSSSKSGRPDISSIRPTTTSSTTTKNMQSTLVSIESLQYEVDNLDMKIKELMEEIDILDITIAAAAAEASGLSERRDQLADELEVLQIEYISKCAELRQRRPS